MPSEERPLDSYSSGCFCFGNGEANDRLFRCASCAAYVKSYKQTIDLAKSAYEAPFAVEMPESLVQSILARAPVRATTPKKARDVG